MQPIIPKRNYLRLLIALSMLLLIIMVPGVSAVAAEQPIARLTEFSGTVMIRSQGSWGVEPQVGLLLYSRDRLVTRGGSKATVTFNDGAVMAISANSNLMIQEQEETKGFFKKYTVAKRRIRLLLGKLNFSTGRSNTQTQLETPTAVCGLRGTAGTLSLGADGQPYIQFTEGGTSFIIGEFLSGVAADLPQELADLNVVQRAAIVANASAVQAAEAQAKAETGEITEAQADLELAVAAKTSAEEAKTEAVTLAENSPSSEIVAEATAALAAADQAIQQADEAISNAASQGATPPPDTPGDQPGDQPSDQPGDETPSDAEGFEQPDTDNKFQAPGSDPSQPPAETPDQPPVEDQEAASGV